jgi:hypothetical protein
MDATTAAGADPAEVAEQVWAAAAAGSSEVVLADVKSKLGCLLRALAPHYLFKIMAKRAKKEDETA